MGEKIWRNTPDDPYRQRRRMAEFLVHRSVPLGTFDHLAVYSNDDATRAVAAMAGYPLAESVVVRPAWYYGYERR